MKKKYVIIGAVVFLFAAISIYLVLDSGNHTFAAEEDSFTVLFTGVKDFNQSTTSEYGKVWVVWPEANETQQENKCLELTRQSGFFAWYEDGGYCIGTVANGYARTPATNNYYYQAPDAMYCYRGFTYDASTNRCTKEGSSSDSGNTNDFTLTFQPVQDFIQNINPYYGSIKIMWDNASTTTQQTNCEALEKISLFTFDEAGCAIIVENGYYNMATNNYFYEAPDEMFCDSDAGFTYNTNDHQCQKTDDNSGNPDQGDETTYTCDTMNSAIVFNKDPDSSSVHVGDTVEYQIAFPAGSSVELNSSFWSSDKPATFDLSENYNYSLSNAQFTALSSGTATVTVNLEYEIDGLDEECTYNHSESVTVQSNNNEPTTYTLNYNCNNPTGVTVICTKPSEQTQNNNNTFTISGNATLANYIFKGWYTNQNGTGTKYVQGDTFTINSGTSKTLYAIWIPENNDGNDDGEYQHKLIYRCGDGIDCHNLPEEVTWNDTTPSATKTISPDIPTMSGYTFTYWKAWQGQYEYSTKYCNPTNMECVNGSLNTIQFSKAGTYIMVANWVKNSDDGNDNPPDDGSSYEELPPDEEPGGDSEPELTELEPVDSEPDEDPSKTGSIPVYIAFILGLGMLGYSYYYTKKIKEN